MSVSPLMSLGVKALAANYAAMQTTGHNIANANVTGYSRQTVQLATSSGQYTGSGFFGQGVDVTTVTRAHDGFLTTEAGNATSLASMDSARLAQLKGLEPVFQNGQGSIGDAVSQLFAGVSDLSSSPDDLSARQVLLARANDLAAGFRNASSRLDVLQAGVGDALNSAVAQVNTLSQGIAKLNGSIASLQGLGQSPNDLLDQRDALVAKLAAQVQVTSIPAPDGTVSIFVGGGQALVMGNQATPLAVDSTDPSGSAVDLMVGGSFDASGKAVGGSARALDASTFGGGAIKGLLDFQNTDLADARSLLNDMSSAICSAFNQQQAAGLDLNGAQGAALFSSGQPAGSMVVNITDPKAIAAGTQNVAGDNTNALAMLGLQDGKLVNGQATFSDAWINAAANIGVRVQSATTAASISGAVADQAEQSRSSQSGVNLDEEASRLIQYQQSYQAAAKMLQVAQAVFDTLLQAAGT